MADYSIFGNADLPAEDQQEIDAINEKIRANDIFRRQASERARHAEDVVEPMEVTVKGIKYKYGEKVTARGDDERKGLREASAGKVRENVRLAEEREKIKERRGEYDIKDLGKFVTGKTYADIVDAHKNKDGERLRGSLASLVSDTFVMNELKKNPSALSDFQGIVGRLANNAMPTDMVPFGPLDTISREDALASGTSPKVVESAGRANVPERPTRAFTNIGQPDGAIREIGDVPPPPADPAAGSGQPTDPAAADPSSGMSFRNRVGNATADALGTVLPTFPAAGRAVDSAISGTVDALGNAASAIAGAPGTIAEGFRRSQMPDTNKVGGQEVPEDFAPSRPKSLSQRYIEGKRAEEAAEEARRASARASFDRFMGREQGMAAARDSRLAAPGPLVNNDPFRVDVPVARGSEVPPYQAPPPSPIQATGWVPPGGPTTGEALRTGAAMERPSVFANEPLVPTASAPPVATATPVATPPPVYDVPKAIQQIQSMLATIQGTQPNANPAGTIPNPPPAGMTNVGQPPAPNTSPPITPEVYQRVVDRIGQLLASGVPPDAITRELSILGYDPRSFPQFR